MVRKKLIISLILLSFTLLYVSPSVLSARIISVEEEVELSSEWIKLGSIAQFSGIPEKLEKELSAIKLEKAARPGYNKRISKQLVKLILKDKGYNIVEFELDIPNIVKVKTLSSEISSENLAGFVKNYVKNNINYDYENLEIEILSSPSEVIIPDANYNFKVSRNKSDYRGSYSLPVDIIVNDSSYKRIYVNIKTKIYKKVFVAKKTIFKGDKIAKNNFRFETKDISNIDSTLITEWNNSLIKDGILTKTISTGDVLTEDYLHKPIIIKWGDEIQAEVNIGGITVKTMVKAKDRGKKGDYILVENLKTGKEFKAEVISRRLVRLVRN